ncbi:tumor necrosis factor receptor superfamily member 5-like isoform 2-T3 [Clarias gariepinus]|uniref:tumor necrosis factor receptor superfamily member 14-like isoform X2 n=1 Tax=Clarias gariepinus TaxID=13013 RepID=UPI00234C81E9|nr:tumor necrosis factor receptor superfamily member 14-like isoform X2 [Clarias gariepinus]
MKSEYENNGGCCYLCEPGNHIYIHRTEFTSTKCVPCVDSTYIEDLNSLLICKTCTVCEAGLKVKYACTQTSDTVCEPLEGFYCVHENMGSCIYAVEHTKCKPGQYIKQKGTAVKDAECAVCPDGTYSSGSLQICKQHTKCQDKGLEEITPGTSSADVKCGKNPPVTQKIAPIVLVVVIVLVLAEALISQRRPFFGYQLMRF